MLEIDVQWIKLGQMILVSVFSAMYGFGGISGKWKRRFLGGGTLAITVVVSSILLSNFSWWFFLCFPLYMLALSLGYGTGGNPNQSVWSKIFKRTYCGMALSCASLPIYIVTGKWQVFALHTIFCILMSIWAGVFGIFKSARSEETAIAVTMSYIPLLAI